MKCAACGYEYEKNFPIAERPGIVYDSESVIPRRIRHNYIYYCPKCGTLKIRVGSDE